MPRAEPSGRRLTEHDAALVKGMIVRGDRHHDVAAWFGVNQGRIAEVNGGALYPDVEPAADRELPPTGPYSSGRAADAAIKSLEAASEALAQSQAQIDSTLKKIRKGKL